MTAELRLGLDMQVNHKLVARVMAEQGLYGLPRLKARRSGPNSEACVAEDLVHRQFSADAPDRLWLTDITEHPTREGKLYCCVVLDAFARKVVGWSIDSRQDAALVTNALGMATASRLPGSGSIVHSDRGCQFTSWAYSQKVRDAGLAPSMGQVGSAFDNAMMESFWGRVQTELLDRRKWRTRLELANELFEYLEVFYNKQRRHSSLEMLTPDEYETLRGPKAIAA
jgi:transposase InsO family protein